MGQTSHLGGGSWAAACEGRAESGDLPEAAGSPFSTGVAGILESGLARASPSWTPGGGQRIPCLPLACGSGRCADCSCEGDGHSQALERALSWQPGARLLRPLISSVTPSLWPLNFSFLVRKYR